METLGAVLMVILLGWNIYLRTKVSELETQLEISYLVRRMLDEERKTGNQDAAIGKCKDGCNCAEETDLI